MQVYIFKVQQTKQKSRDLSSLQLCSFSSVKTWQKDTQARAEERRESSVSSCILYYKYVLHVKQNQETNVSPQRVKTWGRRRAAGRKKKSRERDGATERWEKTQNKQANKPVAAERQSNGLTTILDTPHKGDTFPQHMLGRFQCVCVFAYKAFDFRMSVKSKCQIK